MKYIEVTAVIKYPLDKKNYQPQVQNPPKLISDEECIEMDLNDLRNEITDLGELAGAYTPVFTAKIIED